MAEKDSLASAILHKETVYRPVAYSGGGPPGALVELPPICFVPRGS